MSNISPFHLLSRNSFGDLQRLIRGNAEPLVQLDGESIGRKPRWLTAMLVDLVVWAERPTGVMDQATARWLAASDITPTSTP